MRVKQFYCSLFTVHCSLPNTRRLMAETINLKLKIWRQKNTADRGTFELYDMPGVSTHMSFLEMMDVLNDRLIREGKDPVAFDHDCREGICGMCSMYINGRAHGPLKGTTTCQLHMRHFSDGETVTIEPWRAEAFPVIKDLVVDNATAATSRDRAAGRSRSPVARGWRRRPARAPTARGAFGRSWRMLAASQRRLASRCFMSVGFRRGQPERACQRPARARDGRGLRTAVNALRRRR